MIRGEDHVAGLVWFQSVGSQYEGFDEQAVRVNAHGRGGATKNDLANVSAQRIWGVVVVRAELDVLGSDREIDGFVQGREIFVFDGQKERVAAFQRFELAVSRFARTQTHRFDQVVAAQK